MNHRAHTPLHLGKRLGLFWILDEPARSHNVVVLAVIPLHVLVVPLQAVPGFLRHGSVKRLTHLECDFLGDTLRLEYVGECAEMRILVRYDVVCDFGSKALRPGCVPGVEMGAELATIPAGGGAADLAGFE